MKTSFWTRLFDLISPRPCAICGQRLSPTESVICAVCHLHLPLTNLVSSPYDNPMARLFWGLFPVERAAAWFYYEPKSEVDEMIYDLKYRGHADIGEDLGYLVARRFDACGFFDGIDAIVPIPLTWQRRWRRGYNQSEEIAKGISRLTGLPIYNKVVKRVSFSGSQTKKSVWERQKNVEHAFQLTDGEKIAGKHLLVIDDIVTTGATVKACATELCKAPGVRISVLSLGFTKA